MPLEYDDIIEQKEVGEKVKEKLASIFSSLGIVGVVVIIAILLIGSWYFFLSPRIVNVSINLTELDSGNPVPNAQVTAFDSSGNQVGTGTVTDASGYAVLSNVPSGSISFKVDPSSNYKSTSSIEDVSSSSHSFSLSVEKNIKPQIIFPDSLNFFLGMGCVENVEVQASNEGEIPIQIQFISDPKLQVSSQPLPLNPGESGKVNVSVSLAGTPSALASIKTRLRVKGTNTGIPLDVEETEKPTVVVSPTSITKTVDLSDQSTMVIKQQFIITNTAKQAQVSSIAASAENDIQPWTSIVTSDNSPIKPGESRIYFATITVPDITNIGPYVGQLVFQTPCQKIPIPVQLTVMKRG